MVTSQWVTKRISGWKSTEPQNETAKIGAVLVPKFVGDSAGDHNALGSRQLRIPPSLRFGATSADCGLWIGKAERLMSSLVEFGRVWSSRSYATTKYTNHTKKGEG